MNNELRSLIVRASVVAVFVGALVALGIAKGAYWLVIVASLVGGAVGFGMTRRPYLAWRAATRPLDPEVVRILEDKVRVYQALDEGAKEAFVRRVMRMLVTLDFRAVRGAEDTHELRVLAVAGAATLLIGRPELLMSEHRSVLFYPDAFTDEYESHDDANIAGMVHRQGPVIFSVKALREGWRGGQDGYNVAIHEWAHVLDLDDGFADGIPGMARGSLVSTQDTLKDELARVRGGTNQALRAYAGTNRAELFAVATEVYFERPRALRDSHPELYDVIRDWLGVDAVQLLAEAPPTGSRRERRAAEREQRKKKRRKKR